MCEEGNSIPVLRLRLSYFNVLDSKPVEVELVATVDRPIQVSNVEVLCDIVLVTYLTVQLEDRPTKE